MPNRYENTLSENMVEHMKRFVGETVTIFTTSGGQSGAGFTGHLMGMNSCFVRLLSEIGPAPDCALGNDCCEFDRRGRRFDECRCNNTGAVVDIPIDKIAAFVHNTIK